MNADRFWELNEGLAVGSAAEQLRGRLSELSTEEVAGYQEHFDRAFVLAYRWELWAAAYLIEGGCSDDRFADFRYGLISRGRSVFERSIADPGCLAHVADDMPAGEVADESFGYVAAEVYRSKTNQDMPRSDISQPQDPSSAPWDFDHAQLCQQKLPKLWAKFGEQPPVQSAEPNKIISVVAGLIGWLRGRS